MKLDGVMNGQEYYQARGIHNGVPYRIVQDRGRFLLDLVSIVVGVGMTSCPVGFFGDDWQGVYSWEANEELTLRNGAKRNGGSVPRWSRNTNKLTRLKRTLT